METPLPGCGGRAVRGRIVPERTRKDRQPPTTMNRAPSPRPNRREPQLGSEVHDREARLGGDAALLHTVDMLDHPDVQFRYRAAFTLAARGDRRAADRLIDLLLSGESDHRRIRAARALGRLADPRASAPLGLIVHSGEDWRLRGAAAGALGDLATRLPDPWREVELLHAALGDGVTYVRAGAARALGRIGPPADDLLLSALRADDPLRREGAALALGAGGAARAAGPLVDALSDPDRRVRRGAVWALGEIGGRNPGPVSRAVPALTAILADGDGWIHPDAARALGRIGDHRAIPSLLSALTAPNVWTRRAAALALGRFGGPEAVAALIGALDDRRAVVRQGAALALGQIGGPAAAQALAGRLDDRAWTRFGRVCEAVEHAIQGMKSSPAAAAARRQPGCGRRGC
jgi:HEAT repeat protein